MKALTHLILKSMSPPWERMKKKAGSAAFCLWEDLLVIYSWKPWEDSFNFALETCIKPYCQHIVFPVTHFTDSKSVKELSSGSITTFESLHFQIQSAIAKPGDLHFKKKKRSSDCNNIMPLIFPRSRLTGKGTSTVEGEIALGKPHSIFSKVESLGGEQNQIASLSRSNSLTSLQKVRNNTTSSRFIQKEKKGES